MSATRYVRKKTTKINVRHKLCQKNKRKKKCPPDDMSDKNAKRSLLCIFKCTVSSFRILVILFTPYVYKYNSVCLNFTPCNLRCAYLEVSIIFNSIGHFGFWQTFVNRVLNFTYYFTSDQKFTTF